MDLTKIKNKFDTIDWKAINNNIEPNWYLYTYCTYPKDSIEYAAFKQAYDKKYYNNLGRGLYHPKYLQIVSSAKIQNLF